jgi:hypothetical protein
MSPNIASDIVEQQGSRYTDSACAGPAPVHLTNCTRAALSFSSACLRRSGAGNHCGCDAEHLRC